jgi:hypothetical protein
MNYPIGIILGKKELLEIQSEVVEVLLPNKSAWKNFMQKLILPLKLK